MWRLGSIKIGRIFATDPEVFRPRVDTIRLKSERLMGRMEALPAALQTDAVIGLMLSEAIKTSAIEGESLDRDSVRASLLQLIAQDTVAPRHQDEKAAGAAALMVDVRKHWAEPLDDALLGRWPPVAWMWFPSGRIASP